MQRRFFVDFLNKGIFLCICTGYLSPCAGAIFGMPAVVATEVAPRAVNGKGLAEDGADAVSGKDCRVIEGTLNKDRHICEKRNSAATKKDFKGMEGVVEEKSPAYTGTPNN